MIVLSPVDDSLLPTRKEDVDWATRDGAWEALVECAKEDAIEIFDKLKHHGKDAFREKFLRGGEEYGVYDPASVHTKAEKIGECLDIIGYTLMDFHKL